MNTVKSNSETGTKKPHPSPDPTRPDPKKPDTRIPVKPDEDNDFTFPAEPVREPQDRKPVEEPDEKQERKDSPGKTNSTDKAPFNDPTSKGDPGRIDPSGPENPVLKSRSTVSSWFYILLISMSLMLPATVSANNSNKPEKTEVSAEAQALINRLEEIKSMDKSEMTAVEKKSLRKEVREIKEKLRELSGGVYLSVGAIIIIILLLILLL